MKRVKTLIGIAMIAIMVVAMCAFSASAAMTLNVQLDKTQVEVGDTVEATVSVNQPAADLASFTVQILYDAEALELNEAVAKDYSGTVESVYTEAGKINVNFFTEDLDTSLPEISTIFETLTFTAKVVKADVALTAKFPDESMMTTEAAKADTPTYVEPGDNTYDDSEVSADSFEIVEEGTLGEEVVTSGSKTFTSVAAPDNTVDIDVAGVVVDGGAVDHYKVVIEWANMDFTYTTDAINWNVNTHMWDSIEGEEAAWTGEGIITITNHSSLDVKATASYAAVANGNTELAFTNNEAQIAAPAVSESLEAITTAPVQTIGVTVSAGTITESGKIGTINVSIENV